MQTDAVIQKAADVVEAGEKILVKAGVYYEYITMKQSGTASNPIIFEGEVALDGNGNITQWKNYR